MKKLTGQSREEVRDISKQIADDGVKFGYELHRKMLESMSLKESFGSATRPERFW